MKKFFFLLLILITPVCRSQTLQQGWSCFDGYIFEKDIVVNIFRDSIGNLSGDYCYKKDETRIPLKGNVTGNNLILEETAGGKVSAKLCGKINENDNTITGKWSSTTHSDKTVFLKLNSWTGNRLDSKYEMDVEDKDVELFFKNAKKAILTDNKAWLSKNTKFPLTLYLKKKKVKIKNAKDFLKKYTLVVTKDLRKSIEESCTCTIFSNQEGAMIANGSLWVNTFGKALKISSINN